MCIICVKPTGAKMPQSETIATMFRNNNDGAGYMYNDNGKVIIKKGFMKLDDLSKSLEALEETHDLEKITIVFHFRITTHGGTCKENCHPFPLTDNIDLLKKRRVTCKTGVAHNGIISSVTPMRKDISDTMEYIANYMTPMNKLAPDFFNNSIGQKLIYMQIESKMVILQGDGTFYKIGKFEKDGDLLYSNTSYIPRSYNYYYSENWDDLDLDAWRKYSGSNNAITTTGSTNVSRYNTHRMLCPLPDDGYIIKNNDTIITSDEALLYVSEFNTVYQYDYENDQIKMCMSATAFHGNGKPFKYDRNNAEAVVVTY